MYILLSHICIYPYHIHVYELHIHVYTSVVPILGFAYNSDTDIIGN